MEEELTWVDPSSGRTYLVDPRTGNSYLREQRRGELIDSGSQLRPVRRTLADSSCSNGVLNVCHSSHCGEREGGDMPEWIRRALEVRFCVSIYIYYQQYLTFEHHSQTTRSQLLSAQFRVCHPHPLPVIAHLDPKSDVYHGQNSSNRRSRLFL